MKKITLVFIAGFLSLTTKKASAQLHTVDIGFRFQKTVDLYYENGITAQYNLTRRWAIGASYYTSRLGSALSSNAIKQGNLLVSGTITSYQKRLLSHFYAVMWGTSLQIMKMLYLTLYRNHRR